jgi:uncharacterized protein YjgD (DUF1641 family)
MAEPIEYIPKPPKIGPDAHEELETLLQTMHEHGVLRLANDLIASNTQWSQVIVDGLNKKGSQNAVQNLSVLLMLLSRIEPAQFYKLLSAFQDGLEHVARSEPRDENLDSPGIKGAYKMLNDDSLWRAIMPLIEALKIFGRGLDREAKQPISQYSGKSTKR